MFSVSFSLASGGVSVTGVRKIIRVFLTGMVLRCTISSSAKKTSKDTVGVAGVCDVLAEIKITETTQQALKVRPKNRTETAHFLIAKHTFAASDPNLVAITKAVVRICACEVT